MATDRSSFLHTTFLISYVVLVFLYCSSSSTAIARAPSGAFVAQITAGGSALSPSYFVSNLSIGTPPQPQKLLISTDSTSYSWVRCGSGAPFDPSKSSSFRYVHCSKLATSRKCYESLSPYPLIQGRLAVDTFYLHSSNGSSQGAFVAMPGVIFLCADVRSKVRLGVEGVATFTASKKALPAELGLGKFAYCLPMPGSTAPGPLFLGDGISYLFSSGPVVMNISAFIASAKLFVHQKTGLFSIGLRNLTVDLVSYNLSSPLMLRVSSVEPFTKLPGKLYTGLRKLFVEMAAKRGIKPAASPEKGFDTCFNSSTIGFSRVGPAVPAMELYLVGDGVQDQQGVAWSIFGFNSIVSVSESVSCWAFLRAGAHEPAVLGSFQQQENLIQIDVANKHFGFTGVLDFFQTTCANFNF